MFSKFIALPLSFTLALLFNTHIFTKELTRTEVANAPECGGNPCYLDGMGYTSIAANAFTGLNNLIRLFLGFASSVNTLEQAKEIFEPHLKEFATYTNNKGQSCKRTDSLTVAFYQGDNYFDQITYTADQINAATKKSGSNKASTGKSGKKSKKPKADNASTGVTSQNTGTKNKNITDVLTLPEEKDAYCRCLIKNQELLNVEKNQKKVRKACINKITQKNKDSKE